MRGEYIYVLQSFGGPVKIGVSVNPFERVKELQIGVSKQLFLEHHELAGDKPFVLENMVHKSLNRHRVRGELFNVTVSRAKKAIAEQIALLASGRTSKPNRFEKERLDLGLSVDEMAKLCHVQPDVIIRLEADKYIKKEIMWAIEGGFSRARKMKRSTTNG